MRTLKRVKERDEERQYMEVRYTKNSSGNIEGIYARAYIQIASVNHKHKGIRFNACGFFPSFFSYLFSFSPRYGKHQFFFFLNEKRSRERLT